jgi:hypothetical protein
MFKYYNANLVKHNLSYTIKEICKIYKDKKLHEQTIRGWVKSGDLKVVSNNPILIYGAVLKDFIKQRNESHKQTLAFNEIKCLKCKTISKPLNNEISVEINKNKSIKAVCNCGACNGKAFKFFKASDMENLQKTFIIVKPTLMTLSNISSTACNTHFKADVKRLQMSLRKLN